MSNEDRLKAILAKADTAGEARRKSKEEADARAAEAAQKKLKVETAWKPLRGHINDFVISTNAKLPEHLELFVRNTRHDRPTADLVESLALTIGGYSSSDLRKCYIQTLGNGEISVRMGTSIQMPKKEYRLDALTATSDQVEGIVLDFLEINM
jgi:hypothetical protein